MNAKLLTRDQFREATFARDKHKCLFCDKPAVDAHHIIERRLWDDGGYYLENGASLCGTHHLEAEMTILSVEEIREKAGITKIVVPDRLYEDAVYDKWGNEVLPDGTRLRGPLFHDESVQKILSKGMVLDLFSHLVKACRTMHLPWSPGMHDDDRRILNMDAFVGREVIASVKKDGENTMMYSDYFHARSIDGRNHPSRAWAKNKWSQISQDIPDRWRVNCENLYAKHSIAYDNLESYLYGFGIWNERNERLHWDEMQTWFDLWEIPMVPVLYRGIYDEEKIKKLWNQSMYDTCEGYVLTTVEGFAFEEYPRRVAKFVRPNHVQTGVQHWQSARIVPNKLKGK